MYKHFFLMRQTCLLLPSLLLSLSLLVGCASKPEDELSPFTSDGCSSFPDGTYRQKQLWLDCCVAHDKEYWMGGSFADRLASDQALEACVEKVGEPAIAKLMLAGVRVGGSPYWPTSYRWGYGWAYPRGYQVLTKYEREIADKLLAKYEAEKVAEKQTQNKPDNSNDKE